MPTRPTCSAYREEMLLLGLHRRLAEETLDDRERREIHRRIRELACATGLDEPPEETERNG